MKVRKKPIIVDAVKYERGSGIEDGFFYGMIDKTKGLIELPAGDLRGKHIPYIETLDGLMIINDGDYIVTDIKGERYPIKRDIFEETYEIIDENSTCDENAVCPGTLALKHEQTMENLVHRLDDVESKLARLANMAQDAWSSLDDRL